MTSGGIFAVIASCGVSLRTCWSSSNVSKATRVIRGHYLDVSYPGLGRLVLQFEERGEIGEHHWHDLEDNSNSCETNI